MLLLLVNAALAAPLQPGVTGLDTAKAVHLVFDDAAGTTSGCVSTDKGWSCSPVDVERPVNVGVVVDQALLPVGSLTEAGSALTLVHEDGSVSAQWEDRVPPATGDAAGLLLIQVKNADADQAPMLRLVMGTLSAQIGCADDGSFPDTTPNDGEFYCSEIIPSTVLTAETWTARLSMRDSSGEDVDLGSLAYEGGSGVRFASVTLGQPGLTTRAPFALRIAPWVPDVEAMEVPPAEVPAMDGDIETEPVPTEPPPPEPPPDVRAKAPAEPEVSPPSSGVPILWTLFIFALGFFVGQRFSGRRPRDELDAATPLSSPPIDGAGPEPCGDPVVVFSTRPDQTVRAISAALTPTRRIVVSGEVSLDGFTPAHPAQVLRDTDLEAIRADAHRLASDGGVPPVLILVGTEAVIDTAGGSPCPGADLMQRLRGLCWVVWVLPEDVDLPKLPWAQWDHDGQAGWSVR